MGDAVDDILSDLEAEYDRIERLLEGLTADQWASASGAPGWSVRDVVLHLAQSEAGVAPTLATPTSEWTTRDQPLDATIEANVRGDDSSAPEVFERWRTARRASVAALRLADPTRSVRWAAAPLKPRTLATTRLAEHWAHALDIADPLGLPFPDTDRLRHIAWLGHATLPYALRLDGHEPFAVRCTLDAPSGAVWSFGPASADAKVSGSAGAFCRVGARRVAGSASGLNVSGPDAAVALSVLRNYAA